MKPTTTIKKTSLNEAKNTQNMQSSGHILMIFYVLCILIAVVVVSLLCTWAVHWFKKNYEIRAVNEPMQFKDEPNSAKKEVEMVANAQVEENKGRNLSEIDTN